MTEVPEAISEYMAMIGRKGAKSLADSMTREERVKRAKKAIKARWAKDKKRKKDERQTIQSQRIK